jgi:hypothetical protein
MAFFNPIDLLTAAPAFFKGLFGTVDGITKAISDQKIAAINATTEKERIHANEMVLTLQARRDVMIAESAHSKINIWMRAAISVGPTSVLLKIFLWDKVIGSFVGCSQAVKGTCGIFTTDPLDANLWQVIMVVLGFYFLADTSTIISRILGARK